MEKQDSSMGNAKAKVIVDDDVNNSNQIVGSGSGDHDMSGDSSMRDWTGSELTTSQISTPFQRGNNVNYSSSSESETECDKRPLTQLVQQNRHFENSVTEPPLKKTRTDTSGIRNGIGINEGCSMSGIRNGISINDGSGTSGIRNGICNNEESGTVFLGKFNFRAMEERKRQFFENAAASGKTVCLTLPKGRDQRLKGYGFLELITNDAYELRDTLEQLLECPNPNCHERLDPPVYCCINGHAVCHKCEKKGISQCPVCQSSFLSGRNCLINDILEKFQFRCKFAEHGCSFRSSPETLKTHEFTCDYRTVKCVLSKDGRACDEVIDLPHYPEHVETEHDTYVHTPFTLDSDYGSVLPKKTKLDTGNRFFRFLKDVVNNLNFLEMTHYDETYKIYTISVHLIGKQSEAANFVYTIDVNEDSLMGQFKYSNDCLPNIMSPNEAEKFFPFTLRDKDDTFSIHRDLKYNLKIERKEDFGRSVNQIPDGGNDNSLAEIPVVDI